ncbi:MAG: hypothetical protein SGI94_06095 [Saprospiraceae bacterium]|nr:hypothetical protein [Saprospiraceae bacterium]
MTSKGFFLQLAILSALAAAGLFLINRMPQVRPHAMLSWLGLLFFIALSAFIFLSGRRSAANANKNAFTNTVLGFTMTKMLACAIIIVAYHKIMQPESKWFLLPFFVSYLVFTVFETYWMMKLARTSA